MNTGRLAEIEADARKTLAEDASSSLALWKPWAMDRADDVLALVDVAKAARDHRCFSIPATTSDEGTAYCPLCEAFARLDSGAAEEDA